MRRPSLGALRSRLRLLHLSARTIGGRRYWILPLLPPLWVASQVLFLLIEFRQNAFTPADAQNVLIGIPLTVLGIGLGVRIIAGDIDRRTLEIAYTVPGGTHRVWLAKMSAALLLLVAAEIPLAIATYAFCTSFPWLALYGALQGAVVYLVLSMSLATLFRGEAVGALVAVAVLVANSVVVPSATRFSPFWNPLNAQIAATLEPAQVLAGHVQNHVGWALGIAAIVALTFVRAERREKLLSA